MELNESPDYVLPQSFHSDEQYDFLEKTLQADERTAEFVLKPALHMVGKFSYKGGEINSELVMLEKEAALSSSIGRVEILEEWNGADGKNDRIN